MKARIDTALIRRLKPKAKTFEVYDTRAPGFLVRVYPSGKMVYVCQLTRGKRKTIGNVEDKALTPAKARNEAIKLLGKFQSGEPIQDAKSEGLTLGEFLEGEYDAWIRAQLKTGADITQRLRACFEKFFPTVIEGLTPFMVDQWRTERLNQGRKPATINRDIAALKAAYSTALNWGRIKVNPIAGVKPLKIDKSPKVRFLSEDEETRLRAALAERDTRIKEARRSANAWRAARHKPLKADITKAAFGDYLMPLVLLALNTGLRRGELLALTWMDIDFERRILAVNGETSKSGQTRHVPLNSEVTSTLKRWRAQQPAESDLVFYRREGAQMQNVQKGWRAVLKKAAIENFRFHDLRHHFASQLVMAGVDLNTVRELLGHADMETTLRYAHLAPEHKSEAVERLVRNVVSLPKRRTTA